MTIERWDTIEDAARDAYTAYGLHTQWKNYQGKVMPTWTDLPLPIQQAWAAAVRRILAKAYRIVAHDLVEHIQKDCKRAETELGVSGD